jgi:octaprenyl-diphosphate synthase
MTPFESIKDQLDQVQGRLLDLMHSSDPLVDSCLRQLSGRKGKLLRPALVLLSGQLAGRVRPVHIDLASAIELIHTASLLHDDVIDQADVRRGRPTANVLWGNTAAVLLGDFLLSRAFTLMSQDAPEAALTELCRTAETLCTGELKQNLFRSRSDITEDDYFSIIESKTAALFACSCRIGAMAAAAAEPQVTAAGEYGRHLGIAFQIMDDLSDIRSTTDTSGKTPGTDWLHQKLTLPVIHWLSSDPTQKESRLRMLSELDIEHLKSHLQQAGSLEYACRAAEQHSRQAREQLSHFGPSAAAEALSTLAQNILA